MSSRIFIIDTNVLVAGLITAETDSPTAGVLDAMLNGSLIYLLSPDLLREYRSVLMRPRLMARHRLNKGEIDQILTEITANAIWREPPIDIEHQAPDPGDSHLWALLGSEANTILITGDRLLIEKPRPRNTVISPATWNDLFRHGKPD